MVESKTINRDKFFRLNFILQDNSATTINTYLLKLIEFVIYEEKRALSVREIKEKIIEKFSLEFTDGEVLEAVKRSLTKNGNIFQEKNKYYVTANYISRCNNNISIEDKLKGFINDYIVENKLDLDIEKMYELISRYVYYCFNTNKEVLLQLVSNETRDVENEFEASNEEKRIINDFLIWKNNLKNKFIFQLVSYGYIYCTLTTKKDNLLSKKIFSNKAFYLDANIIFRLAGLNNEDRKNTIKTFIDKCKELNIKLYYTTETYNEIDRVINNRINWLQTITGSNTPPKVFRHIGSKEDIYHMYCDWCSIPGNKIGDFLSFRRYVMRIIRESLEEIRVDNHKYMIDEKYDYKYVEGLLQYKMQKRMNKNISEDSVLTDIKNVLYINKKREATDIQSLFSTQVFMVTADQLLISYLNNNLPGIPIAVLPSLWLTIMLKFTGRTDNDYNAFCLFMNLRYSEGIENDISITELLKELRLNTSDASIKERIVEDVYANKDDIAIYIQQNDYKSVVKKSFEKILNDNNENLKKSFEKELRYRDEKRKIEKEKDEFTYRKLQSESNAEILAREDIMKRNNVAIVLLKIAKFIVIGTILLIIYGALALWFPNLVINETMQKFINDSKYLGVSGVLLIVLIILPSIINKKIDKLNVINDNELNRIKEKYLRKFNKELK